MKIVLASSTVPFIKGGGRFIVDWLEEKLIEYGHEAERLWLPFEDRPDKLLEQIAAFRLMDLTDAGDLVGCWLSSEGPPDQGFGVALLKITTCLQVDPVTKSGLPSPGRTIKVGAHFTVGRRDFAVQLVVLAA